MKWTLRVLGGLFGLILLGVVALATLPWIPVLSDQFSAGPFLHHLKGHASGDLLSQTPVLHDEAYQPGFVILGELHGYATPQILDERFAIHMAERAGMRWYLAELDPMQAIAANSFLETGDGTALKAVFDRWSSASTQWGNKEFYAKFMRLRDYMLANPEHAFRFIGVDAPQHEEAFEGIDPELAMPMLAPSLTTPDDHEAINLTLASAAVARKGGRYAHIRANIALLSQMEGFADQTFYGFWGFFHTLQTKAAGGEPLAKLLNAEDGEFPGRVTSIITMCVQDCYNMMSAANLPAPLRSPDGQSPFTILPMAVDNPYFLRYSGTDELISAMGGADAMLFRIDTPQSPYQNSTRLLEQSGYLEPLFSFPIAGPTATSFDYVIAMRNVEALTPWQGGAFDFTREER
jgi:hypothetical protein